MTKVDMWAAIREYYGWKRNHDVAAAFGITDQAAYGWLKGGIIQYEDVYRRCPEISPDWLLSQGENGPMLRPASQSITGDNNTQVGGDMMQEGSTKKVLELLAAEQENNRRLQEQVASLVGIIQNLTATKG